MASTNIQQRKFRLGERERDPASAKGESKNQSSGTICKK